MFVIYMSFCWDVCLCCECLRKHIISVCIFNLKNLNKIVCENFPHLNFMVFVLVFNFLGICFFKDFSY